MNCQLCQKELDALRDGKLSGEILNRVESHLKTCDTCAGIYRLQILADKVMAQEKDIQPGPFLATRVMAVIENSESYKYRQAGMLTGLLKPALATVSLAAAIFFGILIGNLSRPMMNRDSIPLELVLIDDIALESADAFANQ